MSPDDATLAFIIDTQIAIFDDARHDLQLSIPEIARQAHLPAPTVNSWAQGRNALSLWGLKKLLRVKGLAPLLSRLFDPEEHALVAVMAGVDYDEYDRLCRDFSATKAASHHPESECGVALGPVEQSTLRTKLALLQGGKAVAA